MAKSQETSEIEERPRAPLQRRFVCKHTDPETGNPCGQRFNEKANLRVSFLHFFSYI